MSEEIQQNEESLQETVHLQGMYRDWFLDYASYVILERAVPALFDGLKPVQRRILYSMKRMDDGRFHKVANIIGHSMQFHPHGDAAIYEALVNMGQKDLMVDTQGNWGDFRTGDGAAAARYIEARLTKFALHVAFNAQTTEWQRSYDGRQNEPVLLPVKFPLVLTQGAEGIAVGLATKIMPHNFIELIEASIAILENKPVQLLPDFPTGGLADFSQYNQGQRGGKIRVRAIIETVYKKTLAIRDVPFGTVTSTLIESIVKANDNNKIKIKKITDNTAENVEILIELPPGISPDVTIDALYAFTLCEVSISPNACVIIDDKPWFLGVNDILNISTKNTVHLLKWELKNKLHELSEKLFFSSLEKIFIENRIYRDIEECETWAAVLQAIDSGLEPFKKQLLREVTEEDLIRLTEIKIKRISRFDSFKADELIRSLSEEIEQVQYHLGHITEYAIAYFRDLKEKFGKGRERKTQIRSFDTILASDVAVANEKLYVNRKEGFAGYGLKKDEFVTGCSDIDDVIVFFKNGTFLVTRVSEKAFVGKDIIHIDVWKKNNDRMTYHLIYSDTKTGRSYAKRFPVSSITRDKLYDLTLDEKSCKVMYFTANANSESEIVTVYLSPGSTARKKVFDFDFSTLQIKGRGAQGNIITRWPIRRVTQKEQGSSTLGGMQVWFDASIGKLNTEGHGTALGQFDSEDQVLVFYKNGSYTLTDFDLSNHYDAENLALIEQFDPESVFTVVHYDAEKENFFIKRFKIEALVTGRAYKIISESKGSYLLGVSSRPDLALKIITLRGRSKEETEELLEAATLVDEKGWKALGNRVSSYRVKAVEMIEADEPEIILPEEEDNLNGDADKGQAELF